MGNRQNNNSLPLKQIPLKIPQSQKLTSTDPITPLTCNSHKGETLYGWGECCNDFVWRGFGDKDIETMDMGSGFIEEEFIEEEFQEVEE